MLVSLAVVVIVSVVSARYRQSIAVSLSCVLLLVWWHALARTKTVSWRAVSLVFTAAMAWAPVVAWLTTRLAGQVEAAVHTYGSPVNIPGVMTAVAGFGEESLKLAPLLVVVLLFPGRVRRFATVDWLLLGFASGLGFQLVEDSLRRLSAAVHPPEIAQVFAIPGQDSALGTHYGLGPFGGGLVETLGSTPTGFAGHQVLTALVAVSVGLAVAGWRHGARCQAVSVVRAWVWRVGACAVPVVMFWVVAVDHFADNAAGNGVSWFSDSPFAAGRESTVPAVIRWTWRLTGHGFGRSWLLLALLVVAIALDARRLARVPGRSQVADGLVPAAASRFGTDVPGLFGGVARAVRDMVQVVWRDLAVVVLAHQRERPEHGVLEGRRAAVRRGLAAAVMVRQLRAAQIAELTEPGAPPARMLARRRLITRVVALGGLVVVGVIALVFAPRLAEHVGAELSQPAAGHWLASYFDALGTWWDGLPPGEKMLAIGVVAAVAGIASGGLGTALVVSGIADYGLTHAHGEASLMRNPAAAVRSYARTQTPQGALVDAAQFGLTFIPFGGAGAVAGRGLRVAAEEFARDPVAFMLRERREMADDTGEVRFDWITGLKRRNTWRETLRDMHDGINLNRSQWHRFEANEMRLGNNKILDSYTADHAIVSRKLTQLADVEPNTAIGYMKELITKYKPGERIKDGPYARINYPDLIGEELKGKWVLELPVQRKAIPQDILHFARQHRITINQVHWE